MVQFSSCCGVYESVVYARAGYVAIQKVEAWRSVKVFVEAPSTSACNRFLLISAFFCFFGRL